MPPGGLVRAALIAAAVSGVPSTLWSLARGRDPLEATLAAGALLLPNETRRGRLIGAASLVHLTLSLGWGVLLARALPRDRRLACGMVAGLGIAAVDFGVAHAVGSRRFDAIRLLPLVPQLADHVAFAVTAATLSDCRPTVGQR